MEITFTLQLPRDAVSVPVVRHLMTRSMHTLGVRRDCLEDIEVALTEACTNVLDHAAVDDRYQVSARMCDERCIIDVVDTGGGFDAERVAEAEPTAETGRGIRLMRQLVDTVTFTARPERGTVVHLEKELAWDEAAPARRLRDDVEPSLPGVADPAAASPLDTATPPVS